MALIRAGAIVIARDVDARQNHGRFGYAQLVPFRMAEEDECLEWWTRRRRTRVA